MKDIENRIGDYHNGSKGILIFAVVVSLICLGPSALAEVGADYLDNEITKIKIKTPVYEGQHYEAMVPDTLDLAMRAELAINTLTRTLDSERDYEIYFAIDLTTNPPIMSHEISSVCLTKYLENLPLLRTMSGSLTNIEIDSKLMESLLHKIGKDGLIYMPAENRPWSFTSQFGNRNVPEHINGPYCMPFGNAGRGILAQCVWYQHDKNPLWKRLCERQIDRLLEIGYKKEGAINFDRFIIQGQKAIGTEPIIGGDSWVPGIIEYYPLTGYEPALELARGQVTYFQKKWFAPDGRFLFYHSHLSTLALIDMYEYATTVNDQQLIKLVRKAYEYLRSLGEPLVGFIPEAPNKDYLTTEGCVVADMIILAIKMSQAEVGDYWDDADRYIRNQFAEMQMTSDDWVERNTPAMNFQPEIIKEKEAKFAAMAEKWPGVNTIKDVAGKSVGAWVTWATANDFTADSEHLTIAQCCTGNAARALHYAWDSIITVNDKNVRVNLLLNRASRWVDVNSYLPYEGQVDVEIKKNCNLEVRIPEWVKPDEVSCTVNGKKREIFFGKRYAQIGNVRKKDLVEVTFPITERVVKAAIGTVPYTLVIKGNDVVSITPPGKWCPFYQRSHYRENQVRWVKRKRFVPDKLIKW